MWSKLPPDRPELPNVVSSSHWTIVVGHVPYLFPACLTTTCVASQRARELTLFRIKVRVCSLEHSSRSFFGYCTPVAKKKSAHLALHVHRRELSLSASVRISLHRIHCSPIPNIRSYISACIFLSSSPDLDLPRTAIVSWHHNFGCWHLFMVGCSQNRPPT